jgi:hypothetical protein
MPFLYLGLKIKSVPHTGLLEQLHHLLKFGALSYDSD